jgi:hypothetical protein
MGTDDYMKIRIEERDRVEELSVEAMVEMTPERFDIGERIQGVEGKAFGFLAWRQAWYGRFQAGDTSDSPTHLRVEAADEYGATIPWKELGQAAFLYEQGGLPLTKGYPIRLYVPDGSSACLNVKSVEKIYFLHQPDLGDEAIFGYKNRISVADLKK